MGKRVQKLKKIRLHHEGLHPLAVAGIFLVAINAALYFFLDSKVPSHACMIVSGVAYAILVNFYRCPIRVFEGDSEHVVVAPADGHIVVAEEVEENEYFHDKRLMVSIFMSLFNVHANWIPVDGTVKMVRHYDGNYHRAWLPKASEENERSTIVITTPEGQDILVRQVAGAMARRIVTYKGEGDACFIDEHLGFIKLGSRVDLYLPVGTQLNVTMGQRTVGNETIIARLS